MKPPRSDKSFIDRLEVHIDTIINFFISIISLFEPILNISISHHQKKYQLLPPNPHEPSQKFLSPDPGKSLHPSPENIATPPKHFKQSKKNLSPLTQTQPLKGNVIRP